MSSATHAVTITKGAVTLQATFGAATAGSGTVDVNLGFNNGDITPAVPTDNASAGFTAVVFASFYNPGSTITFGNTTPVVTLTDTSGFSGATACELDAYSGNGSGSLSWQSVSSTGTISGTSVTVPSSTLSGSSTLDFQPGQQVVAVSCH